VAHFFHNIYSAPGESERSVEPQCPLLGQERTRCLDRQCPPKAHIAPRLALAILVTVKVSPFKSLMVYTGKFTVDEGNLTTGVDLSWNEILTGKAQVRFFKLEGDKLSIRTAEQASAVYPGKKVVGTLTWERER
jgi:hypothetical protein